MKKLIPAIVFLAAQQAYAGVCTNDTRNPFWKGGECRVTACTTNTGGSQVLDARKYEIEVQEDLGNFQYDIGLNVDKMTDGDGDWYKYLKIVADLYNSDLGIIQDYILGVSWVRPSTNGYDVFFRLKRPDGSVAGDYSKFLPKSSISDDIDMTLYAESDGADYDIGLLVPWQTEPMFTATIGKLLNDDDSASSILNLRLQYGKFGNACEDSVNQYELNIDYSHFDRIYDITQ